MAGNAFLWTEPAAKERGDRGRGTIRRKRRRRLRWSSPPGLGEQVPQGEQLPCGHLLGRLCKCRKRSNAGDARGAAPCMKITLISPFPGGEGGRGDRGQESKLKAGAGGATKKASPPSISHSGKDSQCRRGSAPLNFPQRQGKPATKAAEKGGEPQNGILLRKKQESGIRKNYSYSSRIFSRR